MLNVTFLIGLKPPSVGKHSTTGVTGEERETDMREDERGGKGKEDDRGRYKEGGGGRKRKIRKEDCHDAVRSEEQEKQES